MIVNPLISNRQKRRLYLHSDINVTPLVDVMMVLLLVFMVTAPLLTTGMDINLPRGTNTQLSGAERAIDVTIDSKGRIFIGDESINIDMLVSRLKAIKQNNADLSIVISGDKQAAYGVIIQVMARLKQAGFEKVGLKTQSAPSSLQSDDVLK